MKIEARSHRERLKRRANPYLKMVHPIMQRQKSTKFTQSVFTLKPVFKMVPPNPPNPLNPPSHPNQPILPIPPRITFLRECSWTSSDSSTQGSSDDADSRNGGRPLPPWTQRESNRVRFRQEELQSFRSEGEECLIGFLLDDRKFSTRTIQDYINNEWVLGGTATVMGREENRYLIHFDNAVDRRAAVLGNPWCCQGATFVVGNWMPNTSLSEVRLARFSVWLQIWFLPFEYQQPLVVERLASAAGEVIRVDWERSRTRNIRFMRVRININPYEPLTSGCTLDCDDGTSRWIQFSYERIEKFCLGCGRIGHTHPNCNLDRQEAQRRIRANLERVRLRYGFPITFDPTHNHFSYRMRAFLNRASRRKTRMVIRQGQNNENTNLAPVSNTINGAKPPRPRSVPAPGAHRRQASLRPILNDERRSAPTRTDPVNVSSQGMATSMAATLQSVQLPISVGGGQQTVQAEQHRIERLTQQPQAGAEGPPPPATINHSGQLVMSTDEEQQTMHAEQNETRNSSSRVQDGADPRRTRSALADIGDLVTNEVDGEIVARTMAFNRELNDRIAELQDELNSFIPSNQKAQTIEYPREPIEDIIEEFDNTEARVQSYQEREFFTKWTIDSIEVSRPVVGDNVDAGQDLHPHVPPNSDPPPIAQVQISSSPQNIPLTLSFVCTINEADEISAFIRDSPSPDGEGIDISGQRADKGKGNMKRSREMEEDTDSGSENGICIRRKLQNLAVQECPPTSQSRSGGLLLLWNDEIQVEVKVLKGSDKLSKTNNQLQGAQDLWNCLNFCQLLEVKASGLHYTWSNRRDSNHVTWERLDRAFANACWIQTFCDAGLENLPIIVSDHSPMVLKLDRKSEFRKRPYRFEIMWTLHPGCKETIATAWNQNFNGSSPFKLTRKLKAVREKLKVWNKAVFGNLHKRKVEVQEELARVQADPERGDHMVKEKELRQVFETILEQEQLFWMQKSRFDWIIRGERNTKFFHTMTKKRRRKNKIFKIKKEGGDFTEDEKEIEYTIMNHFKQLFGDTTEAPTELTHQIIQKNAWMVLLEVSKMQEQGRFVVGMMARNEEGDLRIMVKTIKARHKCVAKLLLTQVDATEDESKRRRLPMVQNIRNQLELSF
ncbi:Endonuclease/exonuclease/phosphatase [Corchorus olitorius]|uniref:Endonuclease/exonuclease/phosphatase n=1 Tax=Corchorus olitorius TaxID=93759 RepID=A0A1R3ICH1_9ROSI|nr:Endonuclease/exonuclease/phosphatase [Corchorus olitorius]